MGNYGAIVEVAAARMLLIAASLPACASSQPAPLHHSAHPLPLVIQLTHRWVLTTSHSA
jgi:hypothetical protein